MKIKMMALCIASATVVTGGCIGGIAIGNAPKNVALKAFKSTIEDVVEREEVKPIYNMLKGGSLSASISSIKEDGKELLEDFSASGKVYFSSKAFMVEDLDMRYGENGIQGDVYVSEDLIYVQEEKILNGAYGIEIDSFADDFADSIFAYGSGSKYAIPDEELYESILNAFENPKKQKKMRKDAKKILKKYAKKCWKIICDNVEFSAESDDVRLNGEKSSVRVISMELDANGLSDIVQDIYDFMVEDDSVSDFIDKYEEQLNTIPYDENKYDSLGDMYETVLEEMEEEVEELCDEIKYDSEFKTILVEMATPKLSSKLLKLTVSVDKDEYISVDFGKEGIKKTNQITLELMGEKMVYEISANDKKSYEAELKINGENIFTIDIDRKKNSYTATYYESGYYSFNTYTDTYTIKGSIETKNKVTTVTMDEYKIEEKTSYYGQENTETKVYKTNLTVIINQKDKIPSKPKNFDNIADISEKDIDDWLKELEKNMD